MSLYKVEDKVLLLIQLCFSIENRPAFVGSIYAIINQDGGIKDELNKIEWVKQTVVKLAKARETPSFAKKVVLCY
jgi:hypothetical protein